MDDVGKNLCHSLSGVITGVNDKAHIAIAADVGGTNIRVAALLENGVIQREYRVQATLSRHMEDSSKRAVSYVVSVLTQTLQRMIDEVKPEYAISGIGIGFPGFFNAYGSTLLASPNLPQIKHVALAQMLSEQLHLPVMMQNDALCAAMGEHRFGAAKGSSHLLHVTLGTGVGGGIIICHRPYVGETGMAMELGHVRTGDGHNRVVCGCGGRGCLETYASAMGVLHSYQHQYNGKAMLADSEAVYQAACAGDMAAIDAFSLAGRHLGLALAHAVSLLDIRTITISGGMLGAWDFYYPSLWETLQKHTIPLVHDEIRVLRSTLADHAGVLGGAALVWQSLSDCEVGIGEK